MMRYAFLTVLFVVGAVAPTIADDLPEIQREAPKLDPSPEKVGGGGFYEGGEAAPQAPEQAVEPLERAPEPSTLGSGGYYRPQDTRSPSSERRSGFGNSRWFGPGNVQPQNTRRYDRDEGYYEPTRRHDDYDRDVVVIHRSPSYPSRWSNHGSYHYPSHSRPHVGLSVGIQLGPHVRLGWGIGCR